MNYYYYILILLLDAIDPNHYPCFSTLSLNVELSDPKLPIDPEFPNLFILIPKSLLWSYAA